MQNSSPSAAVAGENLETLFWFSFVVGILHHHTRKLNQTSKIERFDILPEGCHSQDLIKYEFVFTKDSPLYRCAESPGSLYLVMLIKKGWTAGSSSSFKIWIKQL